MIAYLQEHGAPDQNLPARPLPRALRGEHQSRGSGPAEAKGCSRRPRWRPVAAPEKALHAIGLQGVSAVRQQITEGAFAPLAKRTLAARKARGRTNEKPLIDTAQRRNAVTYTARKGNITQGGS